MNIVTIFNYSDEEKYNTMFKVWLVSVIYNKDKTAGDLKTIRILTKGINSTLETFVKSLNRGDVQIVIRDEDPRVNHPTNLKAKHNIGFKLYNLCKETTPYIYLDSDMLVLTPFTDVIQASKEKSFISVDHQDIERHTGRFSFKFINTGFFVITDTKLLNYEEILRLPIRYRCPGTDQLLIYNFLKTNSIDYTHRKIHYGWNSCAGFKRIHETSGVVSDGIPNKHPVHILHYWDEYKPWITPCPIYTTYSEIVKDTKEFTDYIKDIDDKIPNTKSLFSK